MKLPQTALQTLTERSRKEFGIFIHAFHQYMEDHAGPKTSKLQILIQAYTGFLKNGLLSYIKLDPGKGYKEDEEQTRQ